MQLRLNSLGTRQAACVGGSTQPWLSSPLDSLPSGSAQPLAIPSPPVVIDGGGLSQDLLCFLLIATSISDC